MYIRKAIFRTERRTYTKHLLVESESTTEGPRQKTVCSLGSLSPGPKKKWLALARKLLAALGEDAGEGAGGAIAGGHNGGGPDVGGVEGGTGNGTKPPGGVTVQPPEEGSHKPGPPVEEPEAPAIDPEAIRAEQTLEAGPVIAGHALWTRLALGPALAKAGLPPKAVNLAEMIVLDLLTAPKPGAPLVHWARQTVLPRILGEEPGALVTQALCRQLDRLSAKRTVIEPALAAAEKRLFGHGDGGLVFDLRGLAFAVAGGAAAAVAGTSPPATGKGAEQGRTDTLPAAGLVLDELGFARFHEPLGGDGQKPPALGAVLRLLGRRCGTTAGAVVVIDREAATPLNLTQIRKLGHRCLVTGDGPGAAPPAAPGTSSVPGAAKAQPAKGSAAATPGTGQGHVGGAEAGRVLTLLAAHDERLALLRGPDAGAFVLDQFPLAPETRLVLLLLSARLLNAAELLLDRGGVKRPWHAVREVLRCHQAVTLAVPLGDGTVLALERETGPDAEQAALYRVLGAEL